MDDVFERGPGQRPWLTWTLIAIPLVALLAFAFWPGAGVSGDAPATAVASDAAWRGIIRRERPRIAMQAAALTPAALQAVAAPILRDAQPLPGESARGQVLTASRAEVREPEPAPPERKASLADTIAQIQLLLADRGYAPGPVDGLPGRRTTDAIMKWQLDQGLVVDPQAFAEVLQVLDHRKRMPGKERRLRYASLSSHERSVLSNWCLEKVGSADTPAYYQCQGAQIGLMTTGLRMPAPSADSTRLVATAHAACVENLQQNPQRYFACVGKQIAGQKPQSAPTALLK